MMTYELAQTFLHEMNDVQCERVMDRFAKISAAFPNVRDAVAQAVEDEIIATTANLPEFFEAKD